MPISVCIRVPGRRSAGRSATMRQVDTLVAQLNIQFGNLCQFLPQEKVRRQLPSSRGRCTLVRAEACLWLPTQPSQSAWHAVGQPLTPVHGRESIFPYVPYVPFRWASSASSTSTSCWAPHSRRWVSSEGRGWSPVMPDAHAAMHCNAYIAMYICYCIVYCYACCYALRGA